MLGAQHNQVRVKLVRLLGALLFSSSVLLAFPAVAVASPTIPADPNAPVSATDRGDALLVPGRGEVKTDALAPGEGCLVRPFNPNKGGAYVYASADITCNFAEPRLSVRAELWRKRWYGWQKMAEDPNTVYNRASVYSDADWNCSGSGTYTYETRAYFEITWIDGTKSTSYRYSNSRPTFTC